MKKNAVLVFISALTFFSSCKKMKDAQLTFFVSNAGDAAKWASINVKIGSLSQGFMTPERRNMGLGECGPSDNSTTFNLPDGTYNYTADNGRWSGSITVDNGDCGLIELKY